MPRMLAALVLVLAQPLPIFRADARLIVVYATVRNDRGELATGLDRSAFHVYEDNKPQPIELFRNDDVPASIGLVLDNSGSIGPLRPKVEAAALAFARASNADDELFVMNFAERAQLDVAFTSDHALLQSGIARRDSVGGTALRDAVESAARYLVARGKHDRRVLIVVTDGNDNASAASAAHVRRLAEGHDIVVYSVGIFGDSDPIGARIGTRELTALTEPTGGAAFFPHRIDDLESAVLAIAREIRAQYTIAYRAPQGRATTFRRIRVTASGPERLSVRTRRGYGG